MTPHPIELPSSPVLRASSARGCRAPGQGRCTVVVKCRQQCFSSDVVAEIRIEAAAARAVAAQATSRMSPAVARMSIDRKPAFGGPSMC